jgi:predicted DNA-binding transcriptional regulator AlpA
MKLDSLAVLAASPSPKQRGHTRPKAPLISLDQPGRLRVAHLMALLAVSHSTLYERLKQGVFPKPDGFDGRCPWWRTSTIKSLLEA